MSHFLQFARSCTPGRLKWLRHIVIHKKLAKKKEDMGFWLRFNMKMILDLLSLCAANPKLQVHLHVPGWNEPSFSEPMRFVKWGMTSELMFRGNDLTEIAPEHGLETSEIYKSNVESMLDKHSDAVRAFGHRVPNLSFLPKLIEFDEIRFRSEGLASWTEYADDPQLLPPDGMDKWVQYARLWMTKVV
jgi:hypothetical protein